jgi:hypothetical protein
MEAQPVPAPSSHVRVTLRALLYAPPGGVAATVGGVMSMTYTSVRTVLWLLALSMPMNLSVVLAVMDRGAVYCGELAVGVLPSVV